MTSKQRISITFVPAGQQAMHGRVCVGEADEGGVMQQVRRRRMVDVDYFPAGCLVITPTGRVGTVIKPRMLESKRDSFVRLEVRFSADPRDSVALQPHLLVRVG